MTDAKMLLDEGGGRNTSEEEWMEEPVKQHELFALSILSIYVVTAETPTPVWTPRPLNSHHMNAPTIPAAPVPEAKYL
jgi:hypothetical protein